MFLLEYREKCAALGIDLERSYAEFRLEILAGGPALQRLVDAINAPRAARELITPRQSEILLLVSIGIGYATIATSLGIKKGTVTDTMKEIVERTGAANRTHAVAICIRAGVI